MNTKTETARIASRHTRIHKGIDDKNINTILKNYMSNYFLLM